MTHDATTLRSYLKGALVAIGASALVALALVLVLASTGAKPAVANGQGPDLIVVNLTLVAQDPGYELCGAVKNIGNKKAGVSDFELKINFTGGQSVSNVFFGVPQLQAGATSAPECIKGSIGTKQATSGVGTADVNTAVTETNEGNNTLTASVGGIAELPDVDLTARATADSSGRNTGVLAGVIAAGVAAGAIPVAGAAWYARRRRAG